MEAEACDRCGHEEGPFVALDPPLDPSLSPSGYCHLCAIRSQAMDEWERLLLTDLFLAGLQAICIGADGIMVRSIGQAAHDAGEQLLVQWAERGAGDIQ